MKKGKSALEKKGGEGGDAIPNEREKWGI